ncbi:hypothetical protein F6455_15240 [Proteobacteria bacterium 005FR1]|nr:hypothetical protein [Proteobacteria bacterium 005FR1]
MNEVLRQQYLQALGIESYLPRWILPAAAESALLPPEALAEPEVLAEAEPLPSAESAPVQSAALSPTGEANVVGESPLKEKVELAQERPARRAAERTATEKPLLHQFTLNYWRLGPDIGVLDSRQPASALPTEQLLMNMGAALGRSLSLTPPATITWPSLGASPVAADTSQSVREAREMLHAFLAAQHERQALKAIWLMGASAIYHGLSAVDIGDAGLKDRAAIARALGNKFSLTLPAESGAEQTIELVALPGLAAMLSKPALKAIAWNAIKHLRVSG